MRMTVEQLRVFADDNPDLVSKVLKQFLATNRMTISECTRILQIAHEDEIELCVRYLCAEGLIVMAGSLEDN